MLHLTGQNYNARDIIKNIFSPLIGVLSSSLADDICHRNNLSFVELLQPFAKLPNDAHFRDVSGTSVSVRGLRLNFCHVDWRPPQPVLARRMLNESVTNANNDKTKVVTVADIDLELPSSEPWFEQWRETFLTVQFPADHEFTRHLLSCLLVLSSADPQIVETAHKLTQRVQQMQSITPQKLPKWFQPNEVLNSYVVLHEANQGDLSKAQQGFELLKSTFGDSKCFLVSINSVDSQAPAEVQDYWACYIKRQPKSDATLTSTDLSAPKSPQEAVSVISMPSMQMSQLLEEVSAQESGLTMLHPLSPMQESATEAINSKFSISSESLASQTINPNVWANDLEADAPHGGCLTTRDIDNVRHFVQDYAVRALIPYIEHLVATLSEGVTNKKGVSKSLLSATKRWFVTSKPGAGANNQNAVIYTNESAELQTRKLGDLYFMFGHYNLAFQAYHQAKRDFNADSAWQYYAGALEMAALSAFMLGTAHRKTYDYMEDAIVCYLTVCKMQQFATRATLLSMECLKTARLYSDVAKQLIRMTSEESDLRSALLLEQAAYCFLVTQPAMHRKYAFHIVLAGNRYSRAGQRKHAYRCYRQAYQVFQKREWSLAEDHIQYTVAKQAYMLKQLDEASRSFAHLLRPGSLQSAAQQSSFLKEYIQTQNELLKRSPEVGLLPHALPQLVQSSVRVLTLVQSPSAQAPQLPATNIDIDSNLTADESIWNKIEEMLVITAASNKPFVFKPTRYLYTKQQPALETPVAVQGEPIELAVTLSNSVRCSIALSEIDLLWKLTLDNEEVLSNACVYEEAADSASKAAVQAAIKTSCVASFELAEQAEKTVYFKLTPKLTGRLLILGVVCRVAATADPTASLLGSLQFETQMIRPATAKQSSQTVLDNRLSLRLVPQLPAMSVSFSPVPTQLLAGEILPVSITLRNLGIAPIEEIYLGCDTPRCVSLQSEHHDQMPLAMKSSLRDLSNDKLVKDKEIRGQRVFRLLQRPGQAALEAQQGHTISMWLQAPHQDGPFTLRLLFYYSLPVGANSPIKYRLVRHIWHLQVESCLQAGSTCFVSNAVTNELGLELNLRNQHAAQATEVYINTLSLYSKEYDVNPEKLYIMDSMGVSAGQAGGQCLKSSKFCSLQFRLQEKGLKEHFNDIPTIKTLLQSRLSHLKIMPAQHAQQVEQHMPSLHDPHSFLTNEETVFFNTNISTEEFNASIAGYVPHATLALSWSAIVAREGGPQLASGLHFIKLYKLYETGHCPATTAETMLRRRLSSDNAENKHREFQLPEVAPSNEKASEPLAEDENEDYWEPNENYVGQRCLLEDESFVLAAKG
ncbi:trafficking protein particle complex subunit 8 [Drosophila guanche]|uniref:Blast:Trafficking protein particle complex subunit 8 n=1 Tax=Drosophila guanche TaxID=7266 RepID=A0A3B0J8K0_DROGU|nr:trafficking protein particle complex subunit 8 [Drosophila guanche]SPP76613.1 blast:Trafficking protein particle complex subunit 8 [Drosophila guanche]